MEVFDCFQQREGFSALRVDPSIHCFTKELNNCVALDGISFCYALLLPITGLYVILKFREDKSSLQVLMGPFVSPFREGCEYWEFVRLFEKIVFFLIWDWSGADRPSKTTVLYGVLVIWLVVDNHVLPFKEPRLNKQSFR
jgi:hypothetical protein